jgi:hypothetical protein
MSPISTPEARRLGQSAMRPAARAPARALGVIVSPQLNPRTSQ